MDANKRCAECAHHPEDEEQRQVFPGLLYEPFPGRIKPCHMRPDQPCVGHTEEKKVRAEKQKND